MTEEKTFTVYCFYAARDLEHTIVSTNLTLKEAQAICKNPETSSRTCKGHNAKMKTEQFGPWFYGYTEE